MATVGQSPIAPYTVANNLTFGDLRAALAAGWRDFIARPAFGLFFAAIYAVGGAALVYGLVKLGEGAWSIPVIAGFPIIAPFAAVGLYEVSRRRQAGLPINWRSILWALRGRGDDQVMMVAGIVFVAFSFWMISGARDLRDLHGGIGDRRSETIEMLLTALSAIAMLARRHRDAGALIRLCALRDHRDQPAHAGATRTSISSPRSSSVSAPSARNKAVMIGWAAIIAVGT
jgi:uncharacterized membrane protein